MVGRGASFASHQCDISCSTTLNAVGLILSGVLLRTQVLTPGLLPILALGPLSILAGLKFAFWRFAWKSYVPSQVTKRRDISWCIIQEFCPTESPLIGKSILGA